MDSKDTYQVYAYVGSDCPKLESGIVVDLTPVNDTPQAAVDAVTESGLTSSDLRSRVVFLVGNEPTYSVRSVLAYAALIGLASRRVDVAFGESTEVIVMASVDESVKALGDSGKPENIIEVALIDSPSVSIPPSEKVVAISLNEGLTEGKISIIRYARRAVMTVGDDVSRTLSEFITISSMRARADRERLPLLAVGTELIDTEVVRRAAQDLRRVSRSDNRSALLEHVGAPPAYELLTQAAGLPMLEVLQRLGARSKEVTSELRDEEGNPTGEERTQTLWHCLHPDKHTNGDATPSARVMVYEETGTETFRCYRCLPERVDSLRLVMWAKGMTGDEAAQWLLNKDTQKKSG